LSEAIINLSNRLSFEDSGSKLITLDDDDITSGCKMFGELENADDMTASASGDNDSKGDGGDAAQEQEKESVDASL